MIGRIGPASPRCRTPAPSQAPTPTAARYIPAVNTNALSVASGQPRPAPGCGHPRRAGPLPERRHRPGTGRRARRRRRPTARHRPHLPRRADLGGRPMVLRRWHPQARRSSPPRSTPRSWSASRPPRSTSASTATLHDLRPRRTPARSTPCRRCWPPPPTRRAPSQVNVSQPSDALVAQAAAQSALNALFLGLGAVALLVGAVGVANIMVISVLERRSEIGLRRALGATRGHIRIQFLARRSCSPCSAASSGSASAPLPPPSTPTPKAGPSWCPRSLGRRLRRRDRDRRGRRPAARPPRRPPIPNPSPLEPVNRGGTAQRPGLSRRWGVAPGWRPGACCLVQNDQICSHATRRLASPGGCGVARTSGQHS